MDNEEYIMELEHDLVKLNRERDECESLIKTLKDKIEEAHNNPEFNDYFKQNIKDNNERQITNLMLKRNELNRKIEDVEEALHRQRKMKLEDEKAKSIKEDLSNEGTNPSSGETVNNEETNQQNELYTTTLNQHGKEVADKVMSKFKGKEISEIEWLSEVEVVLEEVNSKKEDKPKEENKPNNAFKLKGNLTDEQYDRLMRIQGVPNAADILKSMISEMYNTTAVDPFDLVEELERDGRIDLMQQGRKLATVACYLDDPVVKEALSDCLSKWENNEKIESYINAFFKGCNIEENNYEQARKRLIGQASDRLQNEDSPEPYKCFITAKYILSQNNNSVVNDKVFAEEKDCEAFIEAMQEGLDEGLPKEFVTSYATEQVIAEMPEDRRRSLFGNIGAFAGKVVKLPYDAKEDFDSAFREALGPHASKFKSFKSSSKKDEFVLKEDIPVRDKSTSPIKEGEVVQEENRDKKSNSIKEEKTETRIRKDPRLAQSRQRDFQCSDSAGDIQDVMKIPPTILIPIVYAVITALIFLFKGPAKIVLPGIGITLVVYGTIAGKADKTKGMLVSVIGHCIFILGLFL